ncbi:MAG: PD40 domain-containing protein [Prevotella sp.]|nr:PD40 domain-containing protein [Prevotella sp.]
MKNLLLLPVVALLLLACSGSGLPSEFAQSSELPHIYPDYAEVTVPVNIAPLNMELLTDADDAIMRFAFGDDEILCEGMKARPDVDDWHTLTAKASGKAVSVEVYARKEGQWLRYKPFNIYVSPDSIDPWLSYRMISPSYVSYEELTINQRCLENFDEQVVVDNMLCSTEAGGQCVNCHSYQQYNPDRMQFHARQTHGGTFIAYDGQLEKISLKSDSMLSAGVYPSWHPWLRLIAYSTNATMQAFHTAHQNKIEVIDAQSDLVLYDIDAHRATTIERQPNELETFPCWAPDGRSLYFCSAHFEYSADSVDTSEITLRAQEVKYNIYRKTFDPDTRQFGERELVFRADTLCPRPSVKGMSATLPRLSPDGRWLLFTMGEWGCFHIWHHDADLWLMDLQTGQARPLAECNSDDTESYHTWSGNGRWVVFSSRRYDGVFTRPFIAHIDLQGHGSKPFELPTQDPDRHRQLLKSYNVPELMRGPVKLTPQQIARVLKRDGTPLQR